MPPFKESPRPPRAEKRSRVNFPVQIAWETSDGGQRATLARAREVAPTSVYFELEPNTRLSSPDLLLELEPGQQLSLCARVRVARVEPKEAGRVGIAVVIEDYCFQAMPCAQSAAKYKVAAASSTKGSMARESGFLKAG